MARALKAGLALASYTAGGALLAAIGPSLWNVEPIVAAAAASATTLTFAATHLVLDTRQLALGAMAEAKRRRRELVALGRYVARIEAALGNRIAEARTPVAAPQLATPVDECRPGQAAELESNLLQFAAMVSARCAGEPSRTASLPTEESAIAACNADTPAAEPELHLAPVAALSDRRTAHYRAVTGVRGRSGYVIDSETDLPADAILDSETRQLANVISLCNRIGDRHASARIFSTLSGTALRSDEFRAELTGFMEQHPELARRLVFEMDVATVLALNAEAVADLRGLEEIGFAFGVSGGTMQDLGRVFNAFGRLAFARIDAGQLHGVDPNIVRALAKSGTIVVAGGVEDGRLADELAEAGILLADGPLFGGPRKARLASEPQQLAA